MYRTIVLAGLLLGATAGSFAQEQPLGDPMRPYRADNGAGTEKASPRRLRLSGVLVSTTRRIAVINGSLYREGDEVQGARITRIEPESVRLRRGDEELVVPLVRDSTRASDKGEPTS